MVCAALRSMDVHPIGFIDAVSPERSGEIFEGAQVFGSVEDGINDARMRGIDLAVVAFGDCKARVKSFRILEAAGFKSLAVRHARAIIDESVSQQPGSVIAPAAVINSNAVLGAYCIINTGAIVEHECIVGEGAMIAPGAVLCGNVSVGRMSWIGAGTVVREDISIGDGSVVGAGSTVVKNIPDNHLWYGSPAHFVKEMP